MSGIRCFTRECVKVTDIRVGINAAHQLRVNDPLVAEVFHLLNERLNNLPRHMYARIAEIRLAVEKMKLVLRIANDNLKGEGAPAFCTVRNYGTRRDPSQSCRRGATGSFRNCCHGPNSLLGVFVCMPPT